MLKFTGKDADALALTAAHERGERWGVCVFDGACYVGTAEQLRAIGVVVRPS